MKINLNTLYKPIYIDSDFIIPKEMYESTTIKDIKKVHANGKVDYNLSGEVELNLTVKGIMVLEDAITLDKIDYPFSFEIDEIIDEKSEYFHETVKNTQNILDIIEILWENIILEVPISITKESDCKLSGTGWQFNNEE